MTVLLISHAIIIGNCGHTAAAVCHTSVTTLPNAHVRRVGHERMAVLLCSAVMCAVGYSATSYMFFNIVAKSCSLAASASSTFGWNKSV